MLVVNATVGEFEAGFETGGQTREHALLVRSLGVRQMAVAVNKMDTVRTDANVLWYRFSSVFQVDWSRSRFMEVVRTLKVFLKQAGFRVNSRSIEMTLSFCNCALPLLQDTDILCVPCSGLTGENLVHQPTEELLLRWYEGPTLLDAIGTFVRTRLLGEVGMAV